jgi:cytochrome d ubiquinol oxidase subunit II
MVSSISPAYDLTIGNSASAPYTLKVMTIVALIFTPLVLVYQGWSYWVFRGRLSRPAQPGPVAPVAGAPGGPAEGEAGSVAPGAGADLEAPPLTESSTS